MSGACSIPFAKIKIPATSSSPPAASPSASAVGSASSSSAHSSIRFASSKPFVFTIRSSQTEGPIRRPAAPSLREPTPPSPSPSPPLKPTPPSQSPPSAAAPVAQPSAKAYAGKQDNVITLEFQRQKAKELQEYFKQKKLDEADQGPFFGFIGKNEISNGRWAMFGFAVGLLTEYATGSNFVDQVKILLSNFGIVDLD